MKMLNRSLIVGGLLGVVLLGASVAATRMDGKAVRPTEPAQAADRSPDPAGRGAVCIGYVDVESGVTPLYPLQPGRVEQVHVKENQVVKAGTPLFSLDRRAAETLMRQAEAALEVSRVQFDQARKGMAQQTLRESQQQAAIEAVQSKVRAAEALLARREELQTIQNGAREIEAARAQVAELKAFLRVEEKKLEELRLADPQSDIRRADADVRAKQAQVDQAKLALEECDLKAPADGTVLRVLVSKGETLGPQPRQPAILFCPQGSRIVRAEVEQEFARRVSIGQKAIILDDTISGDRWTGQVSRLSDWFTQRRSIIAEPLQYNDVRTLECIVTVDPKQPPLRIGQRVRVVLRAE